MADLELAKLITEVATQQYIPPSKETVRDYLTSWINDYAKNQLRLRTYESYDMIIKQHLIPELGNIPLNKLTPKHIIDYCSESLLHGKQNRKGEKLNEPLSARTVRYHFRTLHRALQDAVAWGKIRSNPLNLVKPPKPVK